MSNLLLIVICIGAGILFSKLKIIPSDSHKGINAWVLYVALPAVALRFIPEIDWNPQLLISALAPILIWLGSWVLVSLYARKFKVDSATRAVLIVTCGLGNTSFVGFPVVTAYYGADQLYNAILFDQVSFLLFSTVAIITVLNATAENKGKLQMKPVLKKILLFPSFLVSVLTIILSQWLDFSPLFPFLDKFVATLSPMALFSVGLQLKVSNWRSEAKHLIFGVSYKLLIAPLIVLLFALLVGTTGNLAKITVMEASMSSMITGSILASQYGLNPKLCSLMVAFTLIGSLLLSVFWWWFTGIIF